MLVYIYIYITYTHITNPKHLKSCIYLLKGLKCWRNMAKFFRWDMLFVFYGLFKKVILTNGAVVNIFIHLLLMNTSNYDVLWVLHFSKTCNWRIDCRHRSSLDISGGKGTYLPFRSLRSGRNQSLVPPTLLFLASICLVFFLSAKIWWGCFFFFLPGHPAELLLQ